MTPEMDVAMAIGMARASGELAPWPGRDDWACWADAWAAGERDEVATLRAADVAFGGFRAAARLSDPGVAAAALAALTATWAAHRLGSAHPERARALAHDARAWADVIFDVVIFDMRGMRDD